MFTGIVERVGRIESLEKARKAAACAFMQDRSRRLSQSPAASR